MGEREAMDGESPRRAGLRSQAEQRLHTGTTEHDLAASEADARAIVHELQVHQIELEMQNEELQRAQAEAREASERYCDLFDFAPVGYFVWDQEGRILEVNLAGAALLRRDRGAVIHRRFGQFVATEHHARFADFCARVLATDSKQTCEVKLVADGPGHPVLRVVDVLVEGIAAPDRPAGTQYPGSGRLCRSVVIDISQQKRADELAAANQALQSEIAAHRRAEEEIRSLAEFPQENPNPTLRASGDGRVLYANPPAVRLLETMGWQAGQTLPEQLLQPAQRILEEGETREFDLLCPAGHTFAFAVAASSRAGQMNLYARDVTARKREEQERETAAGFLRMVNESRSTEDLVRAAVTFFQEMSGCEALGIRLKEGDDYPYYEARGFPQEFVQLENQLCIRDSSGAVVRDSAGYPLCACMCGNVICGRFDPSQPFFTARGSFWTNCTAELLASTTETERQARTRNRCNGEGYESVALIALTVGEDRLGLLQLNDRRKGRFTAEGIALWERLAGYLAVALAKTLAQEETRRLNEQFRLLADSIPNLAWWANADGYITWYNRRWYEYTGTTPEQMEGWGWQSVHDPGELPGILERWKASIASGDAVRDGVPLARP